MLAFLPCTQLRQRLLRWLGHVHRAEDGRIPKDLFYGELADCERSRGRPLLRFRNVCKLDMNVLEIDVTSWESLASDRDAWKCTLKSQLFIVEKL